MHVISFRQLREFFEKDNNARVAIQDWFKRVKNADWSDFSELKNDFGSADYVGNDRYVFNIKGNHYRIVAIVKFRIKRVYIRWVGKHKDYDRIRDIENL